MGAPYRTAGIASADTVAAAVSAGAVGRVVPAAPGSQHVLVHGSTCRRSDRATVELGECLKGMKADGLTASVPGHDMPKNPESAVARDVHLLWIQSSLHPCTEHQRHYEPSIADIDFRRVRNRDP
jgi:hypothetical protein